MTVFLGTVLPMALNFAPNGWLSCEGQILPIAQNSALFSLLGVAFGGNGTTNFQLPDLRGKAIIGSGAMPGGDNYVIGQTGGAASTKLSLEQMPAHNHVLTVNTNGFSSGTIDSGNNFFGGGVLNIFNTATNNTAMNPQAVVAAPVGTGAAVSLLNPYLCTFYCIATAGIFPSRG